MIYPTLPIYHSSAVWFEQSKSIQYGHYRTIIPYDLILSAICIVTEAYFFYSGPSLGKGGFAKVYLAKTICPGAENGRRVAIKVVPRRRIAKPEQESKIWNEIALQSTCNHKACFRIFYQSDTGYSSGLQTNLKTRFWKQHKEYSWFDFQLVRFGKNMLRKRFSNAVLNSLFASFKVSAFCKTSKSPWILPK